MQQSNSVALLSDLLPKTKGSAFEAEPSCPSSPNLMSWNPSADEQCIPNDSVSIPNDGSVAGMSTHVVSATPQPGCEPNVPVTNTVPGKPSAIPQYLNAPQLPRSSSLTQLVGASIEERLPVAAMASPKLQKQKKKYVGFRIGTQFSKAVLSLKRDQNVKPAHEEGRRRPSSLLLARAVAAKVRTSIKLGGGASAMDTSLDTVQEKESEGVDSAGDERRQFNGPLTKSNSTNTLFIDHAMAGLTHAVLPRTAAAIRAILLHHLSTVGEAFATRGVFVGEDFDGWSTSSNRDRFSSIEIIKGVELECPPQPRIHRFLAYVFDSANLDAECAIILLVYLERMVASGLRLGNCNWLRVLLSCVLLTTKIWDDQAVWNVDFCSLFRALSSVSDVNRLEQTSLALLDWNVNVSLRDFAIVYFALDDADLDIYDLDMVRCPRLETFQGQQRGNYSSRDEDNNQVDYSRPLSRAEKRRMIEARCLLSMIREERDVQDTSKHPTCILSAGYYNYYAAATTGIVGAFAGAPTPGCALPDQSVLQIIGDKSKSNSSDRERHQQLVSPGVKGIHGSRADQTRISVAEMNAKMRPSLIRSLGGEGALRRCASDLLADRFGGGGDVPASVDGV